MGGASDISELVGRTPDPRLLDQADRLLPADVGRPAVVPPDPAHARLVGIGVTMTAVTLIGGLLLMLLGLIGLLAGGGDAALAALGLGGLSAGTHWGWVHVAEVTADRRSAQRHAGVIDGRSEWLHQIEPYPRWTVSTEVGDDGSIEIQRIAFRPQPLGEDRFTFDRTVETRERHDADEPGADVAERAELMRRQAAADTAGEHDRFRVLHDAYRDAELRHADEAERRSVVRAASEALSQRINENLSRPPLDE